MQGSSLKDDQGISFRLWMTKNIRAYYRQWIRWILVYMNDLDYIKVRRLSRNCTLKRIYSKSISWPQFKSLGNEGIYWNIDLDGQSAFTKGLNPLETREYIETCCLGAWRWNANRLNPLETREYIETKAIVCSVWLLPRGLNPLETRDYIETDTV